MNEPAYLPIPWSEAEKAEMDRQHGRQDRGYKTCLLCGRKVNERTARWVHEVEGGGVLAPVDLDYQNEAADLGWWSVGPDCAERIDPAYVNGKPTRKENPMPSKKATEATTETPAMRRCSGAAQIEVEAHEAPVAEFPIQPSQKDGLGRMCKPHWNAYTRALRVNAQARAKAAGEAPTPAAEAPTPVVRTKAAPKPSQAAKAPRAARAPKPVDPAKAERIAKAKALVAEVDALPAPEAVKRAGDDDVQEALRIASTASVGAEHSEPEAATA